MAQRRVGLWLIGAFGAVGSTTALGIAAVKRRLIGRTGLVTALPLFDKLDLDDPGDFIVGGHDIRQSHFATEVAAVGGIRPAFPTTLIDSCKAELNAWSANVRSGLANQRPSDFIANVQSDLNTFRDQHRLDQVVVINVASTEPPAVSHSAQSDISELEAAVAKNDGSALPVSGWYAYSAIAAGLPFVNFTPSCAASVPALIELATSRKVPIAGQDGKTGETLLKTALAPMFAHRNLNVLSWAGHNLLGNRDGQVLNNPANKSAKLRNKDHVVGEILGYQPQMHTTIEYVPSLDDWKTAWDHIHFQGFLGVPMSLQFTWQGCDSALAAPLILDLARLTLFAQHNGEAGPLPHLAFFFKNPMGTNEHDLNKQWNMLESYVRFHSPPPSSNPPPSKGGQGRS